MSQNCVYLFYCTRDVVEFHSCWGVVLCLFAVNAVQLQQWWEVWSDWSARDDQEPSGADAAHGSRLHGCHQTQHLRTAPGLRTGTTPVDDPLFNTTQVIWYKKGKSNLDFTEARDSGWQWCHRDHMQICTSLQADNHASTPSLSTGTRTSTGNEIRTPVYCSVHLSTVA